MSTASISDPRDLKVELQQPMKTSSGFKSVIVFCDGELKLAVSFHRTFRIPQDCAENKLPPDCGNFSVYSVDKYASQLPATMAEKGDFFIPIYEREAVWIKIHSFDKNTPFAVKVYANGMNVVPEQKQGADSTSLQDGMEVAAEGVSAQDYIVTEHGNLTWLDGVACGNDKVTQFVSKPDGTGHSAEGLLTGKSSLTELQFEVVPLINKGSGFNVKTLTGKVIHFDDFVPSKTIHELKSMIQDREGLPPDHQTIIFGGQHLDDDKTFSDYKMKPGANMWLRVLLGCRTCAANYKGSPEEQAEIQRQKDQDMAIKSDGFTKPTLVKDTYPAADWDEDSVISFNVQLLNATRFEELLGIEAPPTPITAAVYEAYGYPFHQHYLEPSGLGEEESSVD